VFVRDDVGRVLRQTKQRNGGKKHSSLQSRALSSSVYTIPSKCVSEQG
jgi:hypothetical protein